MKAVLYNNHSDPLVLSKNITKINVADVTLQFSDECSVENPVIRVSITNDWKACNYVFLEELGRYYYVESRTYPSGNEMLLNLHVDVLMSHQQQVRNSPCIAGRSASAVNKFIPDDVCTPAGTITQYFRQTGTSPFSDVGTYLLMVGGK